MALGYKKSTAYNYHLIAKKAQDKAFEIMTKKKDLNDPKEM